MLLLGIGSSYTEGKWYAALYNRDDKTAFAKVV